MLKKGVIMGKVKKVLMDLAKKNVALRITMKKLIKCYRKLRYFKYYIK